MECSVDKYASPDSLAGVVNMGGRLDAVLGQELCADGVEVCGKARDDDDCGGNKNCDGKNCGSRDDELDAEDAQDYEDRNDDEVEQKLVCGHGIVNAEEVCENLASACNCGRDGCEQDDNVEYLKEDLHPGLRIQSREGVLIVCKAAELCKLHNCVHNKCEKTHCDNGENSGPNAVLREIADYLVTGGETAADVGTEPHGTDRKRGRPCALGCFVVHDDSPFFLSLFYFGLTFPSSHGGSSTAGQSHGKNVLTYARLVKNKTKPLPNRRNGLLKQFLGQQGFTGEKKSFRGRQTDFFFVRRIPSGRSRGIVLRIAGLSYGFFKTQAYCTFEFTMRQYLSRKINKKRLSKIQQIRNFRRFH